VTLTLPELKGRKLPLLLAAVLFAGANVAFFLAYREGTQTRRAAFQARRDDLKRTVEAAEVESARVTGQKERLGGVSAAIEEFYGHRIGTERETLAPVVDEIHTILKETGVAAPQISYTTAPVQKMPLVQMRISFTIHCDYARFKQLLRAFEASRRWIVVRDVAISRDSDKPGSVQVQVNLLTYFAEAAGSPEAPAPAAGKAAALTARKAG
jgi:Tfp pilus assembly protein PilO